ncbi:uncharacterized protein LOC121201839 [Betta splendens]|uniref:Uncharacterized protein LOC121201839 n=1 Tax=Betta splendens TaxID=158456 RepID=A0A8M1H7J8_BETSP|nr:uncharacterized protein LOC121201839 [Betta splendens]
MSGPEKKKTVILVLLLLVGTLGVVQQCLRPPVSSEAGEQLRLRRDANGSVGAKSNIGRRRGPVGKEWPRVNVWTSNDPGWSYGVWTTWSAQMSIIEWDSTADTMTIYVSVDQESQERLCGIEWMGQRMYEFPTSWGKDRCSIRVREGEMESGKVWDIRVGFRNRKPESPRVIWSKNKGGSAHREVAALQPPPGNIVEDEDEVQTQRPAGSATKELVVASAGASMPNSGSGLSGWMQQAVSGWTDGLITKLQGFLSDQDEEEDEEQGENTLVDVRLQNSWYRWVQFAGLANGKTDCYICTKAKPDRFFVLNTIFSWQDCEKRLRAYTQSPRPWCEAECLLYLGSPSFQASVDFYAHGKTNVQRCEDLNVRIGQKSVLLGMPNNAPLIPIGRFECIERMGMVPLGKIKRKICSHRWQVTTLNCTKPHLKPAVLVSGMLRPILVAGCPYLDQTIALADHFWWCGGQHLYAVLPVGWAGRCARVQLAQEIITFKGEEQDKNVSSRNKRSYQPDPRVYIDAIGQPRGIPNEFKARNEIASGFESILPWITTSKNTEWVNYIYFSLQRFINYTDDALGALGEQVGATSAVAWQNRQALDWILAEKGGVCALIGDVCCTYIPGHTAPDGAFTEAMKRLRALRVEVKEAAGSGSDLSWTNWLENMAGGWKQGLIKLGVMITVGVVVLGLIFCCCIPCLRSLALRAVTKQTMQMAVIKQRVKSSQSSIGSEGGDLFPVPDWIHIGPEDGEDEEADEDGTTPSA